MKLNIIKIEAELERLEWTKYRLAKEMGVSPQAMYQAINPDYNGVTLKTVQKIADALGVPAKDLLI